MIFTIRSRHSSGRGIEAQMTTHATKLVTADELLAMGDIGRFELIRGEIAQLSWPHFNKGITAARVGTDIASFVGDRHLGVVAMAAGYQIESDPDTVRAVDVSFVSRKRGVSPPG